MCREGEPIEKVRHALAKSRIQRRTAVKVCASNGCEAKYSASARFHSSSFDNSCNSSSSHPLAVLISQHSIAHFHLSHCAIACITTSIALPLDSAHSSRLPSSLRAPPDSLDALSSAL